MMHLIFGLKDEFFGCCTRLALCSVLAAEMTLARAPAETSLQKWTSGYDGEILRDGHAAAREGDDVGWCSYSAVLYGGQKRQQQFWQAF